jgi:hypothetical protein
VSATIRRLIRHVAGEEIDAVRNNLFAYPLERTTTIKMKANMWQPYSTEKQIAKYSAR